MTTVIACGAPYGEGGRGQHFAQLVEDARRREELSGYFSSRVKIDDASIGTVVSNASFHWMRRWTPLRFSPGWRSFVRASSFDRGVSRMLSKRSEKFMGFGGEARLSFIRARNLGFESLELSSASGHVEHVSDMYAQARQQWQVEGDWLNRALLERTKAEYDMADVISVCSEYSRQSFLENGCPESKLRRIHLTVQPRYTREVDRPRDDVFRVVYVGSLSVAKGIPVLITAFSKLRLRRAELILVGKWATRGMRKYIEMWSERDSRIHLAPGDPLLHLARASVYVHPSFHDGFGYAPMEALQCGVPVIVTEDTGMKEYVSEGGSGFIVPTGSWQAILERLEYVLQYRPPVESSAGRREAQIEA